MTSKNLRDISITGKSYARLKAFADDAKASPSQIGEALILKELDRLEKEKELHGQATDRLPTSSRPDQPPGRTPA